MPLLKFVLKFPMSGVSRYKLLRYTGVNIEGNMGFIGNNVCLDTIAPHLITIGEGAYVTEGCVVLTHHLNAKEWKISGHEWWKFGEVKIGKNVFIGCHSVICNSVTIGEGYIVGAGSVVTKDIPANEIWGGNPAHFIKKRE